jgi:hypothetical protein
VTVALLNSAGKIIASTVTDSTGWYLFTGLPAGTYTVWVNDSANVLANLVQTADPDGGFDRRSTTTLDGRNDDLLQDHGFAPDGHGPGLGLIGDTIFLDRDGNGQPGLGEGIQGVTVRSLRLHRALPCWPRRSPTPTAATTSAACNPAPTWCGWRRTRCPAAGRACATPWIRTRRARATAARDRWRRVSR